MKIRRTLPSVTQYSAKKSNSQNVISRKNSINLFDRQTYTQSRQFQNQQPLSFNRKKSQSPRKPIFQLINKSVSKNSDNRSSNFEGSIKKTVTFKDLHDGNQLNYRNTIQNNEQIQVKNKSGKKTDRLHRRRSIFERKNTNQFIHQKKNSQIIQAQLNIKQFSNNLKNQQKFQASNQQKILTKIKQLQSKVNQIHGKVIQTNQNHIQQIKTVKNNENHQRKRQYSQHLKDNNVLKLQLEQVRRCERIAKQNQILYGTLAKKLEERTDENFNVIRQIQIQDKFQNYDVFNSKKTPKITAFQDFQHYENKYKAKDYEQIQGNVQIVSPFLLQQNKGKIKLF